MIDLLPHLAASRGGAAEGRNNQGAVRQAKILILDEPTAVLTPGRSGGAVRLHQVSGKRGVFHHPHYPQDERGAGVYRPGYRNADGAK